MRKFFAVAVGSVVALVAFAGAANASATVDLIWIDVSATNAMGNPICLQPANRNCPADPRSPDGGVTINVLGVTEDITLGVILTAGPGGSVGGGVSVNYGDALPKLGVTAFRSLQTTKPLMYLPNEVSPPTNQSPFIDNINALALLSINSGIGLPPSQSAYLGTVTFHNDQPGPGIFEIAVGAFGPGGTDGIGNLAHQNISSTTTFNSALVDTPEPNALTALGSEIAILALLYRRRRYSAGR
jgi:hypothetical protein